MCCVSVICLFQLNWFISGFRSLRPVRWEGPEPKVHCPYSSPKSLIYCTPPLPPPPPQELLNVILSNSYIKNGDHMLRQCHGIPMGSQCSPHIANLYCFGIEKNWIDNIIHSNGLSIANDRIIFRYIDDFLIFSKNEPTPPPQAEYQMSYTDTSLGRNDIVFLGMRVRFEERPRGHPFIRLSIWDKENLFNFQPIKYTSSTSNAPRSLGPGIWKKSKSTK